VVPKVRDVSHVAQMRNTVLEKRRRAKCAPLDLLQVVVLL